LDVPLVRDVESGGDGEGGESDIAMMSSTGALLLFCLLGCGRGLGRKRSGEVAQRLEVDGKEG